jgi:hypothetical protein
MRDTVARIWFAVVAVIGTAGVILGSFLWAQTSPDIIVQFGGGEGDPADFQNWFWRFTITFFYFTIWSNIIVVVTCLLLAIKLDRPSTVFRVFRLYGLISIIITGLVYNLYLARLLDPEGAKLVQNDMVHVAVPILAVLGWLIFGPRTPFRLKYVAWAMLIGVGWLAVSFAHGAFIHWYPYPFMNADILGYPKALLTCFGLLVVAFLLGLGVLGLDKVLPRGVARRADAAVPQDAGPQS